MKAHQNATAFLMLMNSRNDPVPMPENSYPCGFGAMEVGSRTFLGSLPVHWHNLTSLPRRSLQVFLIGAWENTAFTLLKPPVVSYDSMT